MSETHSHDDWSYPHPKQPDMEDGLITDLMIMTEAVAELMIDKAYFSAADVRRTLEVIDSKTPATGADPH